MSFSSSSASKYHRTTHCEDEHDGNDDDSVSHTKKTRDFRAATNYIVRHVEMPVYLEEEA